MKSFFIPLLISAMIITVSCNRAIEYNYVSEKNFEINKEYLKFKPNLDSLVNFIATNQEIQEDFKTKKDTVITNLEGIEAILSKVKFKNIPFEFTGLSTNDFIFIDNPSKKGGNIKDSLPINKFSLFSTQLYPNGYNEKTPSLWIRHRRGRIGDYIDSLDSYEVEELIEDLKEEQNYLKNAKYIVTINDTIYMPPTLLSKRAFDSGFLASKVKVYDTASGEKVAQVLNVAFNSDKVEVFRYSGEGLSNGFLIDNLYLEKYRAIHEFLNLKAPKTLQDIKDEIKQAEEQDSIKNTE